MISQGERKRARCRGPYAGINRFRFERFRNSCDLSLNQAVTWFPFPYLGLFPGNIQEPHADTRAESPYLNPLTTPGTNTLRACITMGFRLRCIT